VVKIYNYLKRLLSLRCTETTSKIYITSYRENNKRRFGQADRYFPVEIITEDIHYPIKAEFTLTELEKAIRRVQNSKMQKYKKAPSL
jgi:hypothetical protein